MKEAREFIRLLGQLVLMSENDFIDCWGTHLGEHYRRKLIHEYKFKYEQFLFYMDLDQVQIFINWTRKDEK